MTVAHRRMAEAAACLALAVATAAGAGAQNPALLQNPINQPQPDGRQLGQPPLPNQQFGPQPTPVQGPPAAPPLGVQPPPQQGPQPAAALRVPTAPFELTPPQEEYLNQILKYWEWKSRQIERFRARFTRWEYDPVFGPKDPYTAKTESTGVVMYSSPDKGLFKVEKTFHYVAPQDPSEKPRYEERPEDVGEHWVCDGRSVFEYNHAQKKLIQYELPPEMRGQAIANSPLPFVFGANLKQLQERFWMRVITPREAKGEYWLEAYPKRPSDAANYKKIEIILDEKDYLPKAIQVFDPTYDAGRNPKRTAFAFEDREVNWNVTLQKLNLFHKEFYEPALPNGWRKEVQRYDQAPPAGPTARAAAPSPNRR